MPSVCFYCKFTKITKLSKKDENGNYACFRCNPLNRKCSICKRNVYIYNLNNEKICARCFRIKFGKKFIYEYNKCVFCKDRYTNRAHEETCKAKSCMRCFKIKFPNVIIKKQQKREKVKEKKDEKIEIMEERNERPDLSCLSPRKKIVFKCVPKTKQTKTDELKNRLKCLGVSRDKINIFIKNFEKI